MNGVKNSTRYLTLLSQALFGSDANISSRRAIGEDRLSDGTLQLRQAVSAFSANDFSELWTLATSHHVILRAFPVLRHALRVEDSDRIRWIEQAIVKEEARVRHALSFLSEICPVLESAGDVVVIKSLDHWPDLGSDLDLYTNAQGTDVVALMREHFKAHLAERSWGDRLANKWNFVVPGLPELVEVHVRRLGQTGEQIAITQSLIARADTAQFGQHTFRVPAPEDRIIISTLQRMYRHFYARLCDIVDNAKLVDSGAVDYGYLKSLAKRAGLWDGLATYLVIVSGYVESYRGEGLPLPPLVTDAARFGNELVTFKRNFLRIPIFPHAARLYGSEWKRLLLNGEIQSALRLSLLPGLATAAALEFRITGNDKGIW
jgi:hypothetical protein